MNNPSPTTMKECDCYAPGDYHCPCQNCAGSAVCNMYRFCPNCQPSEEKECKCMEHLLHKDCKGTYCICDEADAPEQEEWEGEFDKKFVTFYGEEDEYGNTTEGETIIDVDPKEVKSFISQLLKKEREKAYYKLIDILTNGNYTDGITAVKIAEDLKK